MCWGLSCMSYKHCLTAAFIFPLFQKEKLRCRQDPLTNIYTQLSEVTKLDSPAAPRTPPCPHVNHVMLMSLPSLPDPPGLQWFLLHSSWRPANAERILDSEGNRAGKDLGDQLNQPSPNRGEKAEARIAK